MLILQLPRSHIPLYEADYEALRMKQATHMAAIHVSNNSLHLPPATRASARVSERLRLKLPVKPGAEIVRHSQRNKEQFVSLSPFDLAFPVHVRPVSTSVVLFSVSPFDTRFPSFRPHPSPRVTPHVTLDSHDLSPAVSFSPWDVRFPKSSFHRKHHRKSHNRSFQKRLRLQAAVAQYRRERGPAQDRPLFDLKSREVKTLDPSSFLSFSPWQETDFALACGVKLDKFIAARNLKQAVKAASGQRRAKQIKNAQKKTQKILLILTLRLTLPQLLRQDEQFTTASAGQETPDTASCRLPGLLTACETDARRIPSNTDADNKQLRSQNPQ